MPEELELLTFGATRQLCQEGRFFGHASVCGPRVSPRGQKNARLPEQAMRASKERGRRKDTSVERTRPSKGANKGSLTSVGQAAVLVPGAAFLSRVFSRVMAKNVCPGGPHAEGSHAGPGAQMPQAKQGFLKARPGTASVPGARWTAQVARRRPRKKTIGGPAGGT